MRNKLIAVLSLWLVAFAVNAATYIAPSAEYTPSVRDIGLPVGVLDTDTDVRASFTRENWPVCSENEPGENYCNVMEGEVYASVNGGPQQFLCGFKAEGGNLIDRHGNPKTKSFVACSLPPGTLRVVTVSMKNKSTLRTAVTIETF